MRERERERQRCISPNPYSSITSALVAPFNLTLSATPYRSPTLFDNTVVGRMSAVDANVEDTLIYSIIGGDNSTLFTIVDGSSLALRFAGQKGDSLKVVIAVRDSSGGLTATQLFVIRQGLSTYR